MFKILITSLKAFALIRLKFSVYSSITTFFLLLFFSFQTSTLQKHPLQFFYYILSSRWTLMATFKKKKKNSLHKPSWLKTLSHTHFPSYGSSKHPMVVVGWVLDWFGYFQIGSLLRFILSWFSFGLILSWVCDEFELILVYFHWFWVDCVWIMLML